MPAASRWPGEDLDDLVAEIAGVGTVPAPLTGFGPSEKVRPRAYPRTGGPPLTADEAAARVEKQLG